MAAYTANQVSINNGQKNIVVNSNESPEGVSKGDFIHVGTFTPMEINRTYVDGAGKHVIELLKAWGNSNQSNQPAIVIPTTVQFKDTVKALQTANRLLNDNTQAMQDWQTKTGSVTFIDAAGVSQSIKTLKQMQIENDALHPYPWAMRKVEFEANRAQNNEMFAASGFVHFGKHRAEASSTAVNEGLWSRPLEADTLYTGRSFTDIAGESSQEFPILNIAGVTSKMAGIGQAPEFHNQIKFPPAEGGTRTYDSSTGASVTHATPAIAFASETDTNKVVTDRVDMWGLEAYLREVKDADPFVYANGFIQSLASNINGVATVSDNVRPITYFAWYEGDDSSRGRGVNWQTASEANRIKIASDPANNICFDDATGKFYQWCIRGRSFAGVGNGDWFSLETTTANALQFRFLDPKGYIEPRGIEDRVLDFTGGFKDNGHVYVSEGTAWHNTPTNVVGAFRGTSASTGYTNRGIDGECYLLVCGTVNRLNQGAYHPSFNPSGSAYVMNSQGESSAYWYGSNVWEYKSKADTFIYRAVVSNATGNIGSVGLARPDGRFYDGIYASGQGGVCRDMRYSAWGLKVEDFTHSELKVKSGDYRGREKLKLTKIIKTTDSANAQGSGVSPIGGTEEFSVGDAVFVPGIDGVYRKRIISSVSHSTIIFSELVSRAASGTIVHEKETGISISEEYTHVDVIGDPVVILQTGGLKDGWQGSWLPIIPSGTDQEFKLTCPKTSSLPVSRFGGGNGGIWEVYSTTHSWNTGTLQAANSFRNTMLVGTVVVFPYKTKAKMLESSINRNILGDFTRLGGVFVNTNHDASEGALLSYSLISKVTTDSSYANLKNSSLVMINYSLTTTGAMKLKLYSPWANNTHEPLELISPLNNSGATKSLAYSTGHNQQGFINYAYTELKHNGTDWGDDSKMHIVDNQATRLDDNGNTVLYGTARIVEPLGWIKNDR